MITQINTTPVAASKSIPKVTDKNADIKTAIWIYILLLIFEGGLRKWVFPSLATPLLIVRDPIVIWILYKAYIRNLFPLNTYVMAMQGIAIFGIITAMVFGHGNLMVALFGARIGMLYFPLMFVMGSILTREDVLKFGRNILIISLAMVAVLSAQFFSPQSSFINRGVGGDMAGSGFSGTNGYFRPSGTFSFTSGNTLFFGLVASFVVYFWSDTKNIAKWLLVASTVGLIVTVPLSISRSLLSEVGLTLLFYIIVVLHNPKHIGKVLLGGMIVMIALMVLKDYEFFAISTDALTSRFDGASESGQQSAGDEFFDRMFGSIKLGVMNAVDAPIWGLGLGMGTNVGSGLLAGTQLVFLIGEGEWERVFGEQGLILGGLIMLVRILLTFKLTVMSYRKIGTNILPWMLMSFGFLALIQSQMGQPTALGFSTLIGGLVMGAFNDNTK